MRFHPVRIIFSLAICCCVAVLLLAIRQSALLDTVHAPPFGRNFHDDVRHMHASDLQRAALLEVEHTQRFSVLDKNTTRLSRSLPGPTNNVTTGFTKSNEFHLDHDHIWPLAKETHDRIVNQLNHKPTVKSPVTILVYTGLPSELRDSKKKLLADGCSVTDCVYTDDHSHAATADAILWQQGINGLSAKRPGQIWVAFFLESPLNSQSLASFRNKLDWMATYRRDSTLVTPYEKFVSFPNASVPLAPPVRNYATGKTKMAAWFVSNCMAGNGRLRYVQELQQYIQVCIPIINFHNMPKFTFNN